MRSRLSVFLTSDVTFPRRPCLQIVTSPATTSSQGLCESKRNSVCEGNVQPVELYGNGT